MRIVTVIGARPQFIKAALVSAAIVRSKSNPAREAIDEVIVHTGQHYDENMSNVFFAELGTPHPKHNLGVGSASHGAMTGKMLIALEEVLLQEAPDWVLIYGDTNSTLAGALAAAKLHIPVCHVEAGLRSFDKRMPEELNRIVADHVSRLLACPTKHAVENLRKEGIVRGVHHVGDVMYDAALVFGRIAESTSKVLATSRLQSKSFYLATVHRAENTDVPRRLEGILAALAELAREACPVVLPLHPRTRACVKRYGYERLLAANPAILAIEPVSFLDMILLEKHAKLVLTDSGGVQKEAYFHGVPCITLRDETEWVETLAAGWNRLAGAIPSQILQAVAESGPGADIAEYGDGNASGKIVELLLAGDG